MKARLRDAWRRARSGNYRSGLFHPAEARFLSVFLELHNWCATKCKMCHHGFLPDPVPASMAPADYRRLAANVFSHVAEITFCPGMEPLAHPHFIEYLEMAKQEYGVPHMAMMSNFTIMDEPSARSIIRNGVERIQISLDTFQPELYAWIKTNARLEPVLENIRLFQRVRRRMEVPGPELEANFVIMRRTVAAYSGEYFAWLRELGFTRVHLWHLHINKLATSLRGESMWEHKEEYNEFHGRVRRDAAANGIELFRLPEPFTLPGAPFSPPAAGETRKCTFPWHKIQALHNGTFTPCEFWHNEPFWGNLFERPFMDIWNDLDYRRLRWEINTGNLTRRCCRNCVSMSSLAGRADDAAAFVEIDTSATDPAGAKGN